MGYYKRRIIMEDDYKAWLNYLESYYGKEYVEQLLSEIKEKKDKDKVDANRQNENSE